MTQEIAMIGDKALVVSETGVMQRKARAIAAYGNPPARRSGR